MKPEPGNGYELRVRVYFEDTDAGGVVYYANYLRYLERARTEWLRELGFEQNRLRWEEGVGFVVRKVDLRYRLPARLDDELLVRAGLQHLGRSLVRFRQEVIRAETGEIAVEGTVEVACVSLPGLTPAALPPRLRDVLRRSAAGEVVR